MEENIYAFPKANQGDSRTYPHERSECDAANSTASLTKKQH